MELFLYQDLAFLKAVTIIGFIHNIPISWACKESFQMNIAMQFWQCCRALGKFIFSFFTDHGCSCVSRPGSMVNWRSMNWKKIR